MRTTPDPRTRAPAGKNVLQCSSAEPKKASAQLVGCCGWGMGGDATHRGCVWCVCVLRWVLRWVLHIIGGGPAGELLVLVSCT